MTTKVETVAPQRRVLEHFTPKNLHEYIDEFLIGTPEDPETPQPPVSEYVPIIDDTHLVGAFMMYCSACGYFTL